MNNTQVYLGGVRYKHERSRFTLVTCITGFCRTAMTASADQWRSELRLSRSSFLVTSTGERVVNDGFAGAASQLTLRTGVVAERGEIDVDGNDTILLSGVDELAVAKLLFTVEDSTYVSVDLTPLKTVEECPF